MTVYKNMAFTARETPPARNWALSRDQIHARVMEAAKILHIEEYLERRPRALSGGQRQRVALGRAIVRNPKAFLFDEPLSNLDAKLRVETRAEIKKLHLRLQTTTIYVTHDQEEAMTLGDRIVVMKDGIIQQCAPPLDVYDQPVNRFVASFVGTPPINLLTGRVDMISGASPVVGGGGGGSVADFVFGDQRVGLPARMSDVAKRYAGKPVVLGVRPEGLCPSAEGKFNWQRNSFTATVNVLEPLGDKVDLSLSTAAQEQLVCTRTDARQFM